MQKPKIRFKGYQEEWEQRKLPEFVSFFNGLTYTPDDVEETGTLVLRSSNVKNGEIIDADNVYVNDKVATSENVQEGDIIVVVRNGSRALIGKHAQIKASMPNTVIGAFMSGMRSEHSSFVNALLDTSAFENEIAKNMGATINQITGYMFSKMEFMIPSGEEQQQIGGYFQSLDKLITLHHRKCEEMKILKKYMLQKMFPQNGNSVPEIRFLGFTEDWEQRKFKELCDMVTVGIANSATHAYSDSGVVMFRNQNIKPNFLDDTDIIYINSEFEVKYKNKRLKKNDLLVARTGYPGTACVVPEKYENSQTFTTLIARPNENVDPYFLCQYLNSDIGIKYFESTQIGGGQKNSGAGILNEMPVTLPSTIEEEKQIADYFIQLDHLITLHQKKCDELRNIKKFMLQNMFI